MKAINNFVIIEPIKEEPKKEEGLLIMDQHVDDVRYLKAKIISTGNLVEGVIDGDVIHYDRHAGHNINWKEKLYTVITAKDIVLVE